MEEPEITALKAKQRPGILMAGNKRSVSLQTEGITCDIIPLGKDQFLYSAGAGYNKEDTLMDRIPPSEQMEKEFFQGEFNLSGMFLKGAQVMLQKALEFEVTEFLGRPYHSKGERRIPGYRNGYEPAEINTAEGRVELKAPQIRDTEEHFVSQWLPIIKTRTEVLERLIPRLYVKGMSDRDIEDVLRNELKLNKVSKSVISKLAGVINQEYRAFKHRDLSALGILYLFVDGAYLPLRQGTDEKEAVLVAYGITEAGNRILLHVDVGSREGYDSCLAFVHDMLNRNLSMPLLVISDDCPGLRRALKECFPNSYFQICQAHKMRNILSKLPENIREQMKKLLQRVFNAKNHEKGMRLGKELVRRFEPRFPSAMECLEKALPEALTCLKFPSSHRKRISTSNLIERLFGEGKRRTKVIPRFPTEKSALSLFYAVLIDSSRRWRGVKMSIGIIQELEKLEAERPNKQSSRILRLEQREPVLTA